jgi:Fe-S-cluster containining protein
MELSPKQFVPSEVCLKCDGCCRYKQADSIWRPKLGTSDKENLSDLINAGNMLDDQGYIKAIQNCGMNFCKFLNAIDNTCGIYGKRPFECSLYPFIISKTPYAVRVYVHLSCPYVQDHLPHANYVSYVDYLEKFFSQVSVREFLSKNKDMFHDYTRFAPELLYLFELPNL